MKSKKTKISYIPLLPLIFFCTIYPLITRLYLYDTGYEKYDWFDFTTQVSDVFLGWKLVAMEVTGAVMCVMLVYYIVVKHQKIKLNRLIWLLLGYAFLTLLSTILSEYPELGWKGAYEQFEPVWCTLIYVLIVCYIYLLANDPWQIRILMIALAIGTLIVGLIGFFQFFGLDLVTSSFAKYVTLPPEYYDVEMNKGAFKGVSYMTLYNPNYVGSYVCLLLPLFFSLTVREEDRNLRFLYLADCIMLYVSGLGCRSDSARWGMSLIFLLMLVLWLRKIPERKKKLALTGICLLAVIGIQWYFMIGISAMFHDTAVAAVEPTDADTTGEIAEADEDVPVSVPISENLKGIETGDNSLRIDYGTDSFYLSFGFGDDEFTYSATDMDGKPLALEQEEGTYVFTITDPRFAGIQFYAISFRDGGYGLQMIIDGKEWNFANEKDGEPGYYYYNEFGKFDKITSAENYLFKDYGSFGNGRGFIWGETLPLLRHTLILGTGADTFAVVFPQDNYVQKYLNGYETMVVTKPHNMFLQIAVQNGVLSLLLFLTAILIYLYKTWKSRILNVESDLSGLRVGIAVGIIGYLFTGLVNDATICITPIFWSLFGIGIVLSEQQKQMSKKHKK